MPLHHLLIHLKHSFRNVLSVGKKLITTERKILPVMDCLVYLGIVRIWNHKIMELALKKSRLWNAGIIVEIQWEHKMVRVEVYSLKLIVYFTVQWNVFCFRSVYLT